MPKKKKIFGKVSRLTPKSSPRARKKRRYVYNFGNGKADGTRDMKAVLGGKGANLAEMTNIGVPVPPGFTIACPVCIEYLREKKTPDGLRAEVTSALRRLESGQLS